MPDSRLCRWRARPSIFLELPNELYGRLSVPLLHIVAFSPSPRSLLAPCMHIHPPLLLQSWQTTSPHLCTCVVARLESPPSTGRDTQMGIRLAGRLHALLYGGGGGQTCLEKTLKSIKCAITCSMYTFHRWRKALGLESTTTVLGTPLYPLHPLEGVLIY